MGNITIQGDLTGDVPGGEVGGASNLTTAGAIPYVSAPGILNQDPTALFWDAANDRLGIGTNAPGYRLDVRALSSFSDGTQGLILGPYTNGTGYGAIYLFGTTPGLSNYILAASTAETVFNSPNRITFAVATSERARIGTTGNFLIGTTTDSNFKLDVATSGSAGTARFYDQTATTGSTKVRIRSGAADGAGTTTLTVVENSDNQNNNGVQVSPNSIYITTSTVSSYLNGVALIFPSGGIYQFSNSATNPFATKDLSLSRASAGVLQVGDGSANANGQLNARSVHAIGTPTAYNSTGGVFLGGNAGSSWASIQAYSDASGTPKDLSLNSSGGSVLIGTTVNGSFRLDVATSGSSGTSRFYDQTATTGVTSVVIRSGAGQSNNNSFTILDSSGAVTLFGVNPGTQYITTTLDLGNGGRNAEIRSTGFSSGSGTGYRFSSTAASNGTIDLALFRNAAGVAEVNNGTAGTYRDLILRRSQHNGVTVADLPAAAAGNAGSIQYVTDANATTIGSTVAGGGANKVMVWSDGAAWKIFAS